jgi:hypothetical protein
MDDENASIDLWSRDGDNFCARERNRSLREAEAAHDKSKKRNRQILHEEGLSLAQEFCRAAWKAAEAAAGIGPYPSWR